MNKKLLLALARLLIVLAKANLSLGYFIES
jgi:hypothetical protein